MEVPVLDWQKAIRSTVAAGGILFGLGILAVYIVILSGATLKLNFLRPAVERGAAKALGRPVRISGPIELSPSLRPTVSVKKVAIDNTSDWGENKFATIELARTQIDIPDLLSHEITIGEITAEGVSLHLVSDAAGRNNWDPPEGAKNDPKQPSGEEPAAAGAGR
jgi:uncharacterized protein involved in outer membrane biogenesis